MLFSSDVETYNIVVWIMASYDGSDTEKNIFVVNLSAFYYTHSLEGLKFMAKMELIFLSRSNRQKARIQRIFSAVGLNC